MATDIFIKLMFCKNVFLIKKNGDVTFRRLGIEKSSHDLLNTILSLKTVT